MSERQTATSDAGWTQETQRVPRAWGRPGRVPPDLVLASNTMSHTEYTEQRIRQLLTEIYEHPHRGLSMPHGFEVERVVVEDVANMFAPDRFSEHRITINLKVPIIYSARPGPKGTQACLPANRENIEALRATISLGIRSGGLRGRLREWKVSPDEAPAPYLANSTPNGPPADWAVTAILEAN